MWKQRRGRQVVRQVEVLALQAWQLWNREPGGERLSSDLQTYATDLHPTDSNTLEESDY